MYHCTNAHRARLESNVQRGIRQSVIALLHRGLTQCNYFGMCSWIVAGDGLVPTLTNNNIVTHNQRTYWYLTH
jgi:hypothetical protein